MTINTATLPMYTVLQRRLKSKTQQQLTAEEIKDVLCYCRIQQRDLQKQIKGPMKVHLKECTMYAQAEQEDTSTKVTRKNNDHTHNVRISYLSQRTVKEPSSLAVLKV